MSSILFLDAALCDQSADAHHSRSGRYHIGVISPQRPSGSTEIEWPRVPIELHFSNNERRIFDPSNNRIPLDNRREEGGDYSTTR